MATSTVGSQVYSERLLLVTIEALEKNAIAALGPMDTDTYEKFTARMHEIAKKAGVVQPLMAISVKFKPGNPFMTDQAYRITGETQWSVIKQDAAIRCEYVPNVFVVDGSKFVFPS